jgi:bile acid:Na+ symporter, BASS family
MGLSERKSVNALLILVASIALLTALVIGLAGLEYGQGPFVIVFFACLALFAMRSRRLAGFAFTLSVFTFVAASMFYPEAFRSWAGYELRNLITPLIQIIMFGMGTTLSLGDFARVLRVPKAVGLGMFLQFTVMPLTGFTLARMFGFSPQIAAGVILVGSSPGGVASNVMTYLAGGDVALSVTMTACSTLVSPVMTPTSMSILAGRYVPIPFIGMMLSILYMIILPIVAGLIVNRLLRNRKRWLDRALPLVSMAAICFIIAIITSLSRNELLTVGPSLFAVVVMHNSIGYLLGYFGAKLLHQDEMTARTIAIEVGLQNGGMASGLAISVLKSSDAALAPAIFGPWMNTSGSILASWWHSRPVRGRGTDASPEADASAAGAAQPIDNGRRTVNRR